MGEKDLKEMDASLSCTALDLFLSHGTGKPVPFLQQSQTEEAAANLPSIFHLLLGHNYYASFFIFFLFLPLDINRMITPSLYNTDRIE